MNAAVLVTARDALRDEVAARLPGVRLVGCAGWDEALRRIAEPSTRVVLVDSSFPGASGPLLTALVAALPHAPVLRALGSGLPPIEAVAPEALAKLVAHVARAALPEADRKLLALAGLGPDPLATAMRLAASRRAVRIQGEPGSGKKWLAQVLHRLGGDRGAFVMLAPGERPVVHEATSGTLYLENVEEHPLGNVTAAHATAAANGWRVMSGSRSPPPDAPPVDEEHVTLAPLRDRPGDLRPLARLYLDRWRTRLGMGKRRFDPKLWPLLEAHRWPGNGRELETFVVQAVTSARGDVIGPATLPERVLALLHAADPVTMPLRAFEAVVAERLRPVVASWTAAPGAVGLHRSVVDATERALLELALTRTGGNQKAAAALLGVARNTLRARLERDEEAG